MKTTKNNSQVTETNRKLAYELSKKTGYDALECLNLAKENPAKLKRMAKKYGVQGKEN